MSKIRVIRVSCWRNSPGQSWSCQSPVAHASCNNHSGKHSSLRGRISMVNQSYDYWKAEMLKKNHQKETIFFLIFRFTKWSQPVLTKCKTHSWDLFCRLHVSSALAPVTAYFSSNKLILSSQLHSTKLGFSCFFGNFLEPSHVKDSHITVSFYSHTQPKL